MSLDLTSFGLGEMLKCSLKVRHAARDTDSMEQALTRISRYLYDDLVGPDGKRACALIRAYKVHPYGALPTDLQRFAKRGFGDAPPDPAMRCLTLLATVGDEPAWNARQKSRAHQAIALPSSAMVDRAPMIAQLIRAFGLDPKDVVAPDPSVIRKLEGRNHGIFFVENAVGSPYIPAQAEFVQRYGIRSVVGFGGTVTAGDLFAVILFSRVPVTSAAADRFRTIALDVKGGLLPFVDGPVFSGTAVPAAE